MSNTNAYAKMTNELQQMDTNITTTSTNLSTPILQEPQTVTVVTQQHPSPMYQPVYTAPIRVGPKSCEVTCPSCRCRIQTRVTHRTTSKTHIACLLLSWTCCCCCLPYCMDTCRNANHTCPMCGVFIGTYES